LIRGPYYAFIWGNLGISLLYHALRKYQVALRALPHTFILRFFFYLLAEVSHVLDLLTLSAVACK
jgi:phosphoglycerol transferase MdoB-like AlkP superfamily enzyme